MEDTMASTQSEISALTEVRALLDIREEACRAKDIDRLMSLYSPDSTYFDVVPPLQLHGSAAIGRNFVRWFEEYKGRNRPGNPRPAHCGEWGCRVRTHASPR